MFTQGNNTLTFTGTLYLPDDPQTNCQNWDDPSRWVAIDPGGLLHLSFARRDLQVELSNFPQILIEPLEKYLPAGAKRQTLIVLPENITQDDLTSLSTISYELGSHADANNDWHPEIVTENQLSANIMADRNIIFIGQTPTELKDKVDNHKDSVALFPSPWGVGNAVMLIGDQNRQDGFTSASIFSDRAKSILLHGNIAYVDQDPLPGPQPFRNNVSFEDLGYLDRTVRGIGQQNLIYSLYIPYEIKPVLVKLNLGLVHSPDLDILNSSFTVYLNGFSIAGILPNSRSSTAEPVTIGLPAKRFRRGINFIRVTFDLHVPHSSCERALESVWATILNSSTLEINYRNHTPIPSLKDFSLPFSDYPGFVYVIPDQFDQKDLGYISRLSFMLGTAFEGTGKLLLGRDLLWIGGFESSEVGGGSDGAPLWEPTKDSVQVGKEFAYEGNAGIRLTSSGSNLTDVVTSHLHRLLVNKDSKLSITGMIRASPGAIALLQIGWYADNRGPSILQTTQPIETKADNHWQPFRFDVQAPADAVAVQLFLRLTPPAQGVVTADFDNLRVIEWAPAGSTYNPFYDHALLTGSGALTFTQQVLPGADERLIAPSP